MDGKEEEEKRKNLNDAKRLPQALDVVPASAPGELLSVNACNYTGLTARGPWRPLWSVEMRPKGWGRGMAGVYDELVPGTTL